MSALEVAQHEAAHIVVGVALGLRLRRATITPKGEPAGVSGFAWFEGSYTRRLALAIMYAAGAAWDEAHGSSSPEDRSLCREQCTSAHDVRTCVRVAGTLLAQLGEVHARVASALLERDLRATDIERLAQGETLEEDLEPQNATRET